MATSPLVLEQKERERRQVLGSKAPFKDVPGLLTLWRGLWALTVHRETAQWGWRRGPDPPSVPQTTPLPPHPMPGLPRATRQTLLFGAGEAAEVHSLRAHWPGDAVTLPRVVLGDALSLNFSLHTLGIPDT